MDTLEVMNGLNDAATLLSAKSGELASGSLTVWKIVNDARKYVENQLKVMLSAE